MGYTKQGREDGCVSLSGPQQVDMGGRGDNVQGTFQISGNPEESQEIFGNIYKSSGEIWGVISRECVYFLRFQGISDLDGFREEKYIPIS